MADVDDIFKDFALPKEFAGEDEPEEGQEQKPDPVEALKAHVAGLEAKLQDRDLRREAPAVRTPVTPPARFPNLEGLPDPVEDAEGYAKELTARQIAHQEQVGRYAQYQENLQAQQQERIEALWTDFATQFPEYSEKPEDRELVEFVARKVINDAAKRGIDTERYAFTHSDRFIADVGAHMKKLVPRGQAAAAQEKPEAADRTAGVFGGMESGGAPAGTKSGRKEPDMIDELQAMQMKTGFF